MTQQWTEPVDNNFIQQILKLEQETLGGQRQESFSLTGKSRLVYYESSVHMTT